MGGLTVPGAELKDIQDKVLDVVGLLGTTHKHLFEKLEAQNRSVQFSKDEVFGLMAINQRSIQLAGNASATLSKKRTDAVLT